MLEKRMSLKQARVLLTGAMGGIGGALCKMLLEQGASVMLSGRNAATLEALSQQYSTLSGRVAVCTADLTQLADRERLCEVASSWGDGINMLINNAGISDLALLEEQSAEAVERAVATNVIAPIDLCRQLLPLLRSQPSAHIVNIGSVLGGIGHPGYSVYCATKFALRGFTEALYRELQDSTVRVHYLAPRATRTAINSPAAQAMTEALGSAVDPPEFVARTLLQMLKQGRARQVIGWPEKLFVRLNALLPAVVDQALRKQLAVIRAHASRGWAPAQPTMVETLRRSS
jgi:short-subunit dehydrogenase